MPFCLVGQTVPVTKKTFKRAMVVGGQCDQKKIAKCLKKLPNNDFTRKMKGFDTFTKIA